MQTFLKIIEAFTLSLTDTKTEDGICWELTRNVIAHMDFEDCVVYLFDEEKEVLVQVAAYGPKNPEDTYILNPILIKPGEGIVGNVFSSGKPEIIADTRKDPRYLIDDQFRLSEICVPILYRGKAIGVIDSEHSEPGFYTERHLTLLSILASITSLKIIETRSFNELVKLNTELEREKLAYRQQNKELMRVNNQLDELIYHLSHDFRTPVIGVVGLMDVLEESPEKFESIKLYLKKNMEKLDRILLSIYYYSINLRREIVRDNVDLNMLLQEIYNEIKHLRKSRVVLQLDNDTSAHCITDAFRLKIIFRELLENALQYAQPDLRQELIIEAKIEKEENQFIVTISDNGIGFPEYFSFDKKNMFNKGSTFSKGAGIGFFLCQEVAAKIHASLKVSFENNRGVSIRIILPEVI